MKSFPFLAFGLMLVSFLAAEPAEAACRSREVDVKVSQRKESARTPDMLRLNLGYSTNEHGLMEMAWHHFLNQYVGIGGGVSCGVGFLGKNMPNGYITDSDYDQWRMISGEEDEWNIDAAAPKFLFSGIFKTPDLLDFGRCKVACLVEPGAVLAIPFSRRQVLLSNDAGDTKTEYVRGWGGRSVFWQCRGTLMLSFDDFGIGLNYSLNDIDLYSSVRTLSYNGTEFHDFYPKEKKLYHTFGLTLSYSF